MDDTKSETIHGASDRILSILEPAETEEVETTPEEVTEEVTEDVTEVTEQPEVVEDGDTEPAETIQFLDQLFEHEGYDLEQVNTLKVKTKIDGEQGEISLNDLVANYQQGEAGTNRLEKAKKLRAQFDDELTQTRQALAEEYSRLDTLVKSVYEDINSEDLEKLREEEPGEYAARVQERNQRIEQLQKVQSEGITSQKKAVSEAYITRVGKEKELLMDAIPAWSDPETFQTEASQVRNYLLQMGFRQEDIDGKLDESGFPINQGIVDHRAFVIARKAMLFDQSSEVSSPKKKKLKMLPKVGSGKPKTKESVDVKLRKQKRDRLKKTGDIRDAASLILDRL